MVTNMISRSKITNTDSRQQTENQMNLGRQNTWSLHGKSSIQHNNKK